MNDIRFGDNMPVAKSNRAKGIGGHTKPIKGVTDVWLTPLEIIKALGEFDLDPCGESFHKTANHIYEERGLDQEWFGRVWLNPPYSEVETWLNRLVEHGRGIALVFARTEVKWAQEIIPKADSIFFPRGRYYFLTRELKRKGNAGGPSMFLSFGEIPDWSKVGNGIKFEIFDHDISAGSSQGRIL